MTQKNKNTIFKNFTDNHITFIYPEKIQKLNFLKLVIVRKKYIYIFGYKVNRKKSILK